MSKLQEKTMAKQLIKWSFGFKDQNFNWIKVKIDVVFISAKRINLNLN